MLDSDSINPLFRQNPPQAGPIPSIDIGEFETIVLKNGLTVIVVENRKLPKVALQLVTNHDPVLEGDKSGLAIVTGDLLHRGTTSRTKAEIDDEIDFYGGRLQIRSTGIRGSILTKYLEPFLDIFCDVLLHPTFPETEFEKIKKRHFSRLQTVKTDPGEMIDLLQSRVNYGLDHPYGDVMVEESLANITLEDCKEYYNSYWRPSCSYLAVVGDISVDEVRKHVIPKLEIWESKPVPSEKFDVPRRPSKSLIHVIDRPGAVQTELRVTYPIQIHPASADRIGVTVMNHILGGGAFSGYLMSNLREDKGYTYGIRSHFQLDDVVSEFQVTTSVGTEVTVDSIVQILAEMNRIRDEEVDIDHLTLSKNALVGSFARSIEHPQNLAYRVLNILRYDMPIDFYEHYTRNLQAISSSDVMNIAKKYIHPGNVNILVVGNFAAIEKDLRSIFSDIEIKYYDHFGRVRMLN